MKKDIRIAAVGLGYVGLPLAIHCGLIDVKSMLDVNEVKKAGIPFWRL